MQFCINWLLWAVLLTTTSSSFAAALKPAGHYEIASKFTLTSKILGEDRDILISLPASYQTSNDTYPVVVLLDAEQNIEHVVASTRMLAQWNGLPETIIVGIPSTNRLRHFTPTMDINHSQESGEAAAFQQFIENELMAQIDKTYRTHAFRLLVGHSLGGLFAADQLLSNNPFYSAYIIISPSLWWQNRTLFNDIQSYLERSGYANTPVFFGIGDADGDGMKNELMDFYTALTQQSENASPFAHQVFAGEGHMSVTLQATYRGLIHAFENVKYSRDRWESFSSESFLSFLENTKHTYGSSVEQTGELYMELAQFLMDAQNYHGAITVLKANLDAYPDYPLNYEYLANAQALNDQPEMAVETYQKAILAVLKSNSVGSGAQARYQKDINRLQNPVTVETNTLESYQGCFASDTGSVFRFNIQDGILIGSREGWVDFRLFADSATAFYTRS